MYTHASPTYQCPFCKIIKGIEEPYIPAKQKDIFYRDQDLTAFIASYWWPNNPGSVIIMPNEHFENIYFLPNSLAHKIHDFEKQVAIAFKKVYHCDGVSSRQHNEPAANQHVLHYHLNVLPRYENDRLYELHNEKKLVDAAERRPYVEKLKNYFA